MMNKSVNEENTEQESKQVTVDPANEGDNKQESKETTDDTGKNENDEDSGPPGEIVILDVNATALDLNYQRIGKIEPGDLDQLQILESLYLRWNLLKRIENIQNLVTLKELELYGNQITTIEGLETLVNLENLDLSFNRITEIKGLENLTKLEKLYLSANKISKIENLDHLSNLKLLELGNNKIREIENLDGLQNLEHLFIGKNKITTIKNLNSLKKMKLLSIQCNRITTIENLEELTELEEFYVSENGIEEISNLDQNLKLKILDLAMNRITSLTNIEPLTVLEELWKCHFDILKGSSYDFDVINIYEKLDNSGIRFKIEPTIWLPDSFSTISYAEERRHARASSPIMECAVNACYYQCAEGQISFLGMINNNNISNWRSIDCLSGASKLCTVYLDGNPISKDPNYRRKIKLAVPWITQIDATMTK